MEATTTLTKKEVNELPELKAIDDLLHWAKTGELPVKGEGT